MTLQIYKIIIRGVHRLTTFYWYSRPSASFTRNTYTPAGRDFTSRVAVPSCRDVARNVSTDPANVFNCYYTPPWC